MSVKVLGCWEIGFRTPISEINNWEHLLREFNVLDLRMTPVSGIRAGLQQDPTNVVLSELNSGDVESFMADQRAAGVSIVFVDEAGATDLQAFQHPENCMYVFGRSSTSLVSLKQPQDVSVKIMTPTNRGGFWADQAAGVILYDRFLKGG